MFDVQRHGDGTATVVIDRADKLNAMDKAFFRALPALLAELDDDPEVRACVMTGAGRAFSAGGDIIDAATAERIGLVQQVVAHDDLLDAALALARRVAEHPPVAVRSAKHSINQGITAPGLAAAVEATALLFTTEGHEERVQAFLERQR